MGIMAILAALTGSSCSKKTVRVEFINRADQSVIGVSEMLPEQLPDSFAVSTTLDIVERKWVVDSADPTEKTQFTKTGKLRLVLSPVTVGLPAGDILFSLPTLSDDVGSPQGDILPTDRILSLHEDDWRQVEFIASNFRADIEAECREVRRIYDAERVGSGFRKVHVRKRIPEPLQNTGIRIPELEQALRPTRKYEGLGFQKTRGTIPGAFGWQLQSGIAIWGVADATGNVTRLCLAGRPASGTQRTLSEELAALGKKYNIDLVDWCKTTVIKADAQAFGAYFESN